MKGHLPALLALSLLGCVSQPPIAEGVVAIVNGYAIDTQEIQRRFEATHTGHVALLRTPEDRRRYLDSIISDVLFSQEGYRLGLDKEPSVRGPVDQFRRERAADLLRKIEVTDRARAGDAEVIEAYERYYGRVRRASVILVASEDTAALVLKRLAGGESFAAVARAESVDSSASSGGRLGLVRWGMMGSELESVLFSTPLGTVSPPVPTTLGYAILLPSEETENEKPPFEQAQKGIRLIMERRKAEELTADLLDDLRSRREVSVTSNPAAAPDGLPLATIDGRETITTSDLQKRLMMTGSGHDGPAVEAALQHIISDRLMMIEAVHRGYDHDPTVQEATRAYERDRVARELKASIAEKIVASPDAIRAYYEENEKRFMTSEQALVSHILVKSEEKARELGKMAEEGASFAQLARDHSLDITAGSGGDLGYLERGGAIEEVDRAVFDTAVGHTAVVESRFGFHVILVRDHRPAEVMPLSAVRTQIEEQLRKQEAKAEVERWSRLLRERSRIHVDEQALAEMEIGG